MLEFIKSHPFQTLTAIVAIVGLILSLYNFIENKYQAKRKLFIECLDYSRVRSGSVCLQLLIYNRSSLPNAITKVFIKGEGSFKQSSVTPVMIFENKRKSGKTIIDYEKIKSFDFPILLNPKISTSGFVDFQFQQAEIPLDSTTVSLEVHTTLHRPTQIELELHKGDFFPNNKF